uniref:NADH-ubiquinone oxidoreductase chain 2 n=1 Tax=Tegra novaehollandiae viridinotata TaxID=1945547 RepID=A0A1Q1MP36_9ORTH|nr:NADH dehydrogenase subunit 2 [Tegra novaehollandiae viridinotata]
MFNPSKFLFMLTMMSGTMISISSNSWLGAWMGLEINLLSFIPLIINSKNPLSTEAALKYFLIQSFASSVLLFSFVLMQLSNKMILFSYQEILIILLVSSLMLKMGAAPFHFWFPGTMEGLSWINCFILMTWQKIAPLVLTSYVIKLNMFLFIIIISCIITGSLGGLNQTSLRKFMAYSSINHLGWMISGMTISEKLWVMYFIIYSMLNLSIILMLNLHQISYLSQTYFIMNNQPVKKFYFFTLMLSLGGLPPFLGFLPKWMLIQALITLNQLLLTTLMVITTLVTLFYYIRLTFSGFIFSPLNLKWSSNVTSNNNNNYMMMISILSLISLMGLPMSATFFWFMN